MAKRILSLVQWTMNTEAGIKTELTLAVILILIIALTA
jgi:hypothetical protein